MLKDHTVASHRIDHRSPLFHRIGKWFFQIDMFAGICGRDRDQSMPMIRRSNYHHIHFSIRDQIAEVPIGLTVRIPVRLINLSFAHRGPFIPNITHSHHAHARNLTNRLMRPKAIATADNAHIQGV